MARPLSHPRSLAVLVVSELAALSPPHEGADAERRLTVLSRIDSYREETWRWQRLMGRPRTPTRFTASRFPDPAYRRWVLERWKKRAALARRQARRPPHLPAWLCIHRYEGPWGARTGNGYFGGLQMDLAFQRRHGRGLLLRKGTADKWTPLEQMWVAEGAYRSGRGFHPWPNSARACGLI